MIRSTLTALTAATLIGAPALAQEAQMDIVDTAIADGNFTTLVAAVEAADLVETLKGDGPFTVFAPTDDAFSLLPEGTVPTLLENIPALTGVLTYHVVPDRVMSGDLEDGMTVETVNGDALAITIENGTVMVDGATVTTADIDASNGVIHVIDGVILPGM